LKRLMVCLKGQTLRVKDPSRMNHVYHITAQNPKNGVQLAGERETAVIVRIAGQDHHGEDREGKRVKITKPEEIERKTIAAMEKKEVGEIGAKRTVGVMM